MERFFLLSDPTKKPLWNLDSSIRIAHKVAWLTLKWTVETVPDGAKL